MARLAPAIAERYISPKKKKEAEEAAGRPVDVEVTKEGGVLLDGKEEDEFFRELEVGQSRAKQKKRRGYVSTVLASNDEEGRVRRPSLLSA